MTENAGPAGLSPAELGAYFALIEVSSLVRHAVEQQLRDAGDLSYVQFQLLATLGDAPGGSRRMTGLADGVVYSRSGLTYQVSLLERAGYVTRTTAAEDERGVTVTLTEAGRGVLAAVFPGHVAVLRELLFDALDDEDIDSLSRVLTKARERMRSIPPRSARSRRRNAGPA
ncbi:MarR family winged helix-turn-helix transcriptional regulator [Microbacterium sp. Marseille-Q6965]|uniref:MarR family winged helix-turn-helix transcriptional regulator n=1 Tax=Microbacterium sp. Marseille-Q6965 TaxID=2965072 RepID=UPI0021B71D4A|nr:MarR family winged helix-turn-helix transcriptional regulator [Microbacterium sp. Marseille-Q6965]